MNSLIQKLITHRAKKLPLTDVLYPPFTFLGGTLSAGIGLSDFVVKGDGILWRPLFYGGAGCVAGFTAGLFPIQFGVVLLAADLYHSHRKRLAANKATTI